MVREKAEGLSKDPMACLVHVRVSNLLLWCGQLWTAFSGGQDTPGLFVFFKQVLLSGDVVHGCKGTRTRVETMLSKD